MTAGTPREQAPLPAATECVALRGEDQDAANILFVPTCSCPRCAPEGLPARPAVEDRAWISERLQRPRVAAVELGPTGRVMLG